MDTPSLLPWVDAVDLSADKATSLRAFAEDVLRFNRSQNLVSRRNPIKQINTMVWEAFAVSRSSRLSDRPELDLGSGGGFPGIPLAILRPAQRMDLLERRGSRCDFLRRELSALQLEHVRVLEGDAGEFSTRPEHAQGYGRVWLKAVAEPSEALALARPFVARRGAAAIFRPENWKFDNSLLDSWTAYTRLAIAPEPSGKAAESQALHLFHI